MAGCTPPAEENEGEATQNQATCEVTSGSSLATGQELVADLTCAVSNIYQGKRLSIAYDESLTSLKLVVSGDKAVGQIGTLNYKLPRKKEFQAKLKLTGVAAGKGQLKFKILRKKSNWDFTVVAADNALTKMQDSSGKAYGRSVLRLDTSQTLVSNDETVCRNAPLNALLVSSDNFTTCEKVYVQKGDNTNHVIIPKQTWGLNKTYKLAVKTASGAFALNRSGNPVSFNTNNANHNTVAHVTKFDAGSIPQVLNNHFHLEKDGELWYYINKGTNAPRYDASECRSINYKATDDKQFKNLSGLNQADRELAKTILNRNSYYIASVTGGGNTRLYRLSTTIGTNSNVGGPLASNLYYLCFVKIPERA